MRAKLVLGGLGALLLIGGAVTLFVLGIWLDESGEALPGATEPVWGSLLVPALWLLPVVGMVLIVQAALVEAKR